MSIRATTFDPARRLDIYLRVSRAGNKKFIFVDTLNAAVDISSYAFQLYIKRYEGDKENTILLTVGSGLTIGGTGSNELTASVTESQTNIKEGVYYWELFRGSNSKTYLTGTAILHNGKFDGVPSDISEYNLTITESGGTPIIIQISDSGGTSSGAGDVTGPSSSTDGNFVLFNGSTGKVIKESGIDVSSYVPNTRTIAGLSLAANRSVVDIDTALSDRTLFSIFYTDFLGNAFGEMISNVSGSGASATAGNTIVDQWHPGIARLQTGISSTGRAPIVGALITTKGGAIVFESDVNIPVNLSDSTDRYIVYVGLVNSFTAESSDQICFKYSDDINSGRWQGITSRNGSNTTVNGGAGQVVATATWYKLRIEINAAATSVEFFVNGTSIGTSTTNIPQETSADQIQISVNIRKTAGTNSRAIDCDYINCYYILTTSR